VAQAYDCLAFSDACTATLSLVKTGNKYIDDRAPWALYKQGDQGGVAQVLYSVLESSRLAAYLLSPIIPNLSTAIYRQLGLGVDFNPKVPASPMRFEGHAVWGLLPANQPLADPEPIFRRLKLPNSPENHQESED